MQVKNDPKRWLGFKRVLHSLHIFCCCQKVGKNGASVVPLTEGGAGAGGGVAGTTVLFAARANSGLAAGAEQKTADKTVGTGEKPRLTVTIRKPSARTRAALGAGGAGAMSGATFTASKQFNSKEPETEAEGDETEDVTEEESRPVVLGRVPSAILSKKYTVPTRYGYGTEIGGNA